MLVVRERERELKRINLERNKMNKTTELGFSNANATKHTRTKSQMTT